MTGIKIGPAELRLLKTGPRRNGRISQSAWMCPECQINSIYGTSQFARFASFYRNSSEQQNVRDGSSRVKTSKQSATQGKSKLLVTGHRPLPQLQRLLQSYRDDMPRRSPASVEDPFGLIAAVQDKDPQNVHSGLLRALDAHAYEYIAGIPNSTWTELIRVLDPHNSTLPVHRIHRHTNARRLASLGIKPYRKEQALNLLNDAIDIRRRSGSKLDIVDYRMLLGFASLIGNKSVAENVWHGMHRDAVRPDVSCYNSYLEAVIFEERTRLQQGKLSRQHAFKSVPVHTEVALFNPEFSQLALELFEDMTKNNVQVNTRTMCVVMIALARVGDITAIDRMLQSTWGIDANAIRNGEQPASALEMPSDSPLYPNTNLLVTVADAYGMNGQCEIAVRLVDYIAQTYTIALRPNVWYSLIKWLWIFARKSRGVQSTAYQKIVLSLYDAMLAADANIPDDPQREHMIITILLKDLFFDFDRHLRLVEIHRERYLNLTKRHRIAVQRLEQAEQANSTEQLEVPLQRSVRSLNVLRHEIRLAQWAKDETRLFLARWVALLLKKSVTTKPSHLERSQDFRRRGIPNLLRRFGSFINRPITYGVEGGTVRLQLSTGDKLDQEPELRGLTA